MTRRSKPKPRSRTYIKSKAKVKVKVLGPRPRIKVLKANSKNIPYKNMVTKGKASKLRPLTLL